MRFSEAGAATRGSGWACRGWLCCALTGALVLVLAANALALSGKAINAGTPFESGPPAVAVDSSGTAYVAWANTKDLPPTTVDVVQYCTIPAGATACAHSGTLTPADGASNIDDVQVLADGSTIVILADVYGAQGNMAQDYTPEQEWQSTDGGAIFTLVNGGLSVTSGILNADTAPLGAVIVPGTDELGYGWNTAGGSPPTFNAFPLTSPPECSAAMCGADFASLEPDTNPDQLSNAGGQFASEAGVHPGVLGIFNTDFTSGPLGCPVATPSGTAYAWASGAQSAANNYNVSPGTPGSAWKVPVAQADCNVDDAAVGGGPSGFGVVEDNEATNTTVYHQFNENTGSFAGSPLITIANQSEQSAAVSQDGAGGVYTTFLAGAGGPIDLSYSDTAGSSFTTPVALSPDTDGSEANVTSSVGPSGQGWAAWTDNGSVFAQQFDAADAAAAAPATPSDSGASTSTTITIKITCEMPCMLTITLTIDPTVTATTARKVVKHVTVTLASGTFTITGKSKAVSLRLTKAGKALLKADHGRLTAKLTLTQKIGGRTVVTTHTLKITPRK